MRSARREFRPARDARYHGMPGGLSTLVPAPLRRTNNEDDDAQRILVCLFVCFIMETLQAEASLQGIQVNHKLLPK